MLHRLALVATIAVAGSGCVSYMVGSERPTSRGLQIAIAVEAVAAALTATWFVLDRDLGEAEQGTHRALLGVGTVIGADLTGALIVYLLHRAAAPDPD